MLDFVEINVDDVQRRWGWVVGSKSMMVKSRIGNAASNHIFCAKASVPHGLQRSPGRATGESGHKACIGQKSSLESAAIAQNE